MSQSSLGGPFLRHGTIIGNGRGGEVGLDKAKGTNEADDDGVSVGANI